MGSSRKSQYREYRSTSNKIMINILWEIRRGRWVGQTKTRQETVMWLRELSVREGRVRLMGVTTKRSTWNLETSPRQIRRSYLEYTTSTRAWVSGEWQENHRHTREAIAMKSSSQTTRTTTKPPTTLERSISNEQLINDDYSTKTITICSEIIA